MRRVVYNIIIFFYSVHIYLLSAYWVLYYVPGKRTANRPLGATVLSEGK